MQKVHKLNKIILAPCSFKGSLTSAEVCDYMAQGILKIKNLEVNQIIKIPIADGGEGTVDCILKCLPGKKVTVRVKDPLMKDIYASYGLLESKIAVIEMAASSGLPLIKKSERNPLIATTYGFGQLIIDALDKGCKKIILGLGGSATNDCGHGMAMSLGARFLNDNSQEITEVGGGILDKIKFIDLTHLDKRINQCEFIAACDVKNPLVGINGASRIFGPQKGATEDMVEKLDQNLNHFGKLLESTFNKELRNLPGAGAAGGLGGGVMSFLNARFEKGIDLIKELTQFDKHLDDCDLVLTGEGCIDGQTLEGKALMGVIESTAQHKIPCIGIAGKVTPDSSLLLEKGLTSIFSIVDGPMSEEEAISQAGKLLSLITERIVRVFISSSCKSQVYVIKFHIGIQIQMMLQHEKGYSIS